jgi:hypothetical protein
MFSTTITPSIRDWCPLLNFGYDGLLNNLHTNLISVTVDCRPPLNPYMNYSNFSSSYIFLDLRRSRTWTWGRISTLQCK